MKKCNWTEVKESNKRVPAGCYVCLITGVVDHPEKEYLEVIYDIAYGDFKNAYATEFGEANPWAHSWVVSYKSTMSKRFKHFLNCLEASNKSFSVAEWQTTSDENAFIGKFVGAAWGIEHYVNNAGEQRERATFPVFYSAQEAKEGAKVPEDKFTDEWKAAEAAKANVQTTLDDDDDLPF